MRGSGLVRVRNNLGLRILLVVMKEMVAEKIARLLNLSRFKSLHLLSLEDYTL
jgi:hypothetical protein